mgnify:CR=1 FL=1
MAAHRGPSEESSPDPGLPDLRWDRRGDCGARDPGLGEGAGMETLRRLWTSHVRTALGAGLGAAAGVVYYQTVGCKVGGGGG